MDSLMKYIQRTSRSFLLYANRKLEGYGLGGQHIPYILRIVRQPGVAQDQLAEGMSVNKSNVARQLAYLTTAGIVRRETNSQDRRQLLVYPTPLALELHPIVRGVIDEWNALMLDGFSGSERDALFCMLERITERAQAHCRDGKGGAP